MIFAEVIFASMIFTVSTVIAHLEDEIIATEKVFFGKDIPKGYFSRSNLEDCHDRFHHRFFDEQCLIFGGVRANVTEFPHMAVIGWIEEEQIQWKCGGSLITRRFVLTAAHCAVDENNNVPKVVRFGDVDLLSEDDDSYAQQLNIIRFTRHPKHRLAAKYNDIALIELEADVNITFGVCPACLWNDEYFPYNTFDVAGFGSTGYAIGGSRYLLKAFLHAEHADNCTAAFVATRGFMDGIANDQLCAANIAMDTCQGDSGGPLQTTLHTYRRKVTSLVGITSFGNACGFGSLGVYQRIQPHIKWISSVVGESMDAVDCVRQYEPYLLVNKLEPDCAVASPYINRVQLIWEDGQQQPKCSGTLIDYNTVLTTASCTLNPEGKEPVKIRILGQNVSITDVQRYPGFNPGSITNNIALIRLGLYLKNNSEIAPACLRGGSGPSGISSLRIAKNSTATKSQIFIPAIKRCDQTTLSMPNVSKMLNDNHDCWSTDYRMLPGICEIDQGGPFLDRTHTELHAINIYAKDCGSYNPLITLRLERYKEWIESFVLERSVTPEPPIVFRDEDQQSLFFKPCITKKGIHGKCIHIIGCGSEIEKLRVDKTGVTLCGFEEGIDLICCPNDSIGTMLTIPTLPLLSIIDLEPTDQLNKHIIPNLE